MLCLTPYYVTLHCILKCFAATTENTIFTFEAWEIPVGGGHCLTAKTKFQEVGRILDKLPSVGTGPKSLSTDNKGH